MAENHAPSHVLNDVPVPVLVPELVRGHARWRPDAVAVSGAGESVTYRQLHERAASIAAALGDVHGAAVAVRMPSGPRQLAALLAVLNAGAHLLWLGVGDAGERGRSVLADLRPACLLLEGDPAADELAQWYRTELGGRVVAFGPVSGDVCYSTHRHSRAASAAYVAYTSGSTGRPKGIAQTHAALAQFVTWLGAEFDMGPGSRVAQWVAPEHDPALCEVFATLASGGTLCPVPARIRVNPDKLVDWLAEERITLLQTVPSFARELLKAIRRRGAGGRLASLRHLLLMGEALPGELANGLRAALPAVRLVNLYGPTETIAATWHEVTDDVHGTVPIGRSIPGRQVLVLDEEDRPCPPGVTGEIVIRSRYVADGYLGVRGLAFRPLRAAGAAGRTYRTGDLARRREDGLLEFRGRKDLQVKLAGNRVELTDIEAALAAHDSVLECAVVALTDQDGFVTHLVVYVVPHRTPAGEPVASADAWRTQLRERFGRSAVPALFETMDGRLPRNVAGKVDRRRLPDARRLLAQSPRPPRTGTAAAEPAA